MKYFNVFITFAIITLSVLFCQSLNEGASESGIRGNLTHSVVSIVNDQETGGGTGFLLQNDYGRTYIVTNSHVCEHTKNEGMVKVKTAKKTIKRKVVEIGNEYDLCVIEAGYDQEALKMAYSYTIGNKSFVMGHPYLNPLTFVSGELVAKQIISLIRWEMDEKHPTCDGPNQHAETIRGFFFTMLACVQDYQSLSTTIPTYPGNSGSPVVDVNGEVVGVIFAGSGLTNWGFAVPLEDLRAFVNKY